MKSILILLVGLGAIAAHADDSLSCATPARGDAVTQLAEEVQKSSERVEPLSVIRNFHYVTPEVFRGSAPNREGVEELVFRHKVKTIIDLESFRKDEISKERELALQHDVKFYELPLKSYPGMLAPLSKVPKKQMDAIVSVMLDPANQPVYVHCMKGEDRTGLAVGIYLVKSGKMTPAEACKDMLAHGFHPKFKSLVDYYKQETGYECK